MKKNFEDEINEGGLSFAEKLEEKMLHRNEPI
jgi:hypothetical protein